MLFGITTMDPSLRWDDVLQGDALNSFIPAQAGIHGL